MEETLISPPPSPSDEEDSSLDASSLPYLPFDVVEQILVRLPVKFLLQFRCVSKSWNSLITDNPKFAKKHLCFSRTNNGLLLNTLSHSKNTTQTNYILKCYPIKSTFTTTTSKSNTGTQLHYPPNMEFPFMYHTDNPLIGSCDGILCLAGLHQNFIILWNPSTRKSKELPNLVRDRQTARLTSYGFGYDSLSDNYKVVVVLYYLIPHPIIVNDLIHETQVYVQCLGTNFWRKIQEFPPSVFPIHRSSGKFVCGKLNWLTTHENNRLSRIILSLDLGNESYEEVLQPDYGEEVDVRYLIMGVLNGCLSLLSRNGGVWVMKEYGNKESWTKMFSLPYMENCAFTKPIYIFEDHQLLLGTSDFDKKDKDLLVYDSENGIVKFHMELDNNLEVSVESLISP